MLDVEDWAEIRRLRRSEGVSISEIARVLGISREHCEVGVSRCWAAAVSTDSGGVGGGRGRATDPGVVEGVPDDAGHGDRGADRLVELDPHA